MPGTFSGINSLTSALEAYQTQLDITGQNIANVSTPGYSRQIVNLSQTPGSDVTLGGTFEIGNGVSIDAVNRIRDLFLQQSVNSSTSDLGMANQQAGTASNVGSIVYNSNGSGISNDLDQFFNAWSALATNPGSATKLTVQQTGQTLANDISGTYSSLQTLSQQTSSQIPSMLQQAQSDANKIAALNTQILKAQASGAAPNTLLDQRDAAVQDLAGIMNVTVQQTNNGAYTVSSGNLVLVNQSGAQTIPTKFNAATSSLSDGTTSYSISSGKLAGIFDSLNKITSYESSLNTLADQLRSQVNSVYATAATSTGQTGALFFNSGTGAASLDLDSTGLAGPPPVAGVKNDPNSILTGTSGGASDVGVAQQLFGLSSANVSGLGGTTFSGYYAQLVGQVGQDGQTASANQSTQQAVSQQVQSQVQSNSGVNLNEEMSNMLRFQNSFQAAAQALNTMDTVIQSMISTIQ